MPTPDVNLYEAMRTLRAVRRLRPDPIPADVLERVLAAASYAPTGGNRQPWRVVLVRNGAAKGQLGTLYAAAWARFREPYVQAFAGRAPEERAAEERMLAAADHLAAHFHEAPALVVFCFNPKEMAITDARLARVSVVGGASIYPAVENLLLACRAEGLGCVLTTLLCAHEPDVRTILDIPEPWGTACVIPIGYPVGRGHGPVRRRTIAELVFDERFGAPHTGPTT